MLRQRGFDLDSSCKLWWPFYRYGAEQTRVLDMSGTGNHGTNTGSTPDGFDEAQHSKLRNGGFEVDGTGGNTFDWWTDTVGGTSTVNKDTVEFYNGAASCRLDVDASGSFATVFWGIDLLPGKRYRISGAGKVSAAGKQGRVTVIDSSNSVTLKADGTWASDANSNVHVFTSTDWETFSVEFVGHPSYTVFNVFFARVGGASASASLWADDLYIVPLDADARTGWRFDGEAIYVTHSALNLGKAHTLLYTGRVYSNLKKLLHAGDGNNTVYVDGTKIYYKATCTEVSVEHGGGIYSPGVSFAIVRNGTSVSFYKNGSQIGTTQTLDANNDLILSILGSRTDLDIFFQGILMDVVAFNRALTGLEVKAYYELSRGRMGL